MSADRTSLHRLLELSKESSGDKRRQLLREVTDLFLSNADGYTPIEREHFGAIMAPIAKEMEVAVRQHLARALSSLPTAPHALIWQLANDQFSVAHDVLARSPVLQDNDLVEIAENKDQEYLKAIAVRSAISPTVSEALVNKGDDHVLMKLLSNPGAVMSRSTLEKVVDRSEINEQLQAPLIARQDLPVDLLNEMFSFVSTALRTQIMQKIEGLPQEMLDKALSDTKVRFAREVRQIGDADRRARAFVSEMAQRNKLHEGLLTELLRAQKLTEFAHAFARLGDIDVQAAMRIVRTNNVEGVAIVCRAAHFKRETFSTLVVLIEESTHLSAATKQPAQMKSVPELLAIYDQVTPDAARRIIRFWKVRREMSVAAIGAA